MDPHPMPDPVVINQLSIAYGPMDSGSGHCGIPLIFTNVGESVITLAGYPKVAALDANGDPVEEARQEPSGYLGGLRGEDAEFPTVDLSPGQSASAMVESMTFEEANGRASRPYVSISVTPPGESQAAVLEWECDGGSELQIHPVVPGETGQEP